MMCGFDWIIRKGELFFLVITDNVVIVLISARKEIGKFYFFLFFLFVLFSSLLLLLFLTWLMFFVKLYKKNFF